MKRAPKQKYIVRKYVLANSAAEAVRLDRTTPVRDVWVIGESDDKVATNVIGFDYDPPDDIE